MLRDSGCPGFARAAYAIKKDLCHFRYVSPLSQSGSSSACQLSSGLFLKIKKKISSLMMFPLSEEEELAFSGQLSRLPLKSLLLNDMERVVL